MIRRRGQLVRRSLHVEPLEPRALLTAVASKLFVKFDAVATSAQEQAALRSVAGTIAISYPDDLFLISLSSGSSLTGAIQRLEKNSVVAYAQTDRTIHDEAATVTPNDPGYPYSWALNNADNVDIDAPEAWAVTTGSPSVIVAVLDSGLDTSNPDFAGRIWTNPTNDAASGYPNDLHGWNFVANNNNISDDNGHGTHVTSLIAATGNNGTGIAGVAWNVQIMPVKFLDSNGDGTTDEAVSAIDFAVNHGARVINASWGGVDYTQPLADAIAYANAHNVVFVTAAGNEGVDNDVVPSYPASIRDPNTLSVAAVDVNGQFPSFSNYGPTTVDIAAPGVTILGDYPYAISKSSYQVLSGTSMSTAYVSGVAALLASEHPEYTAAQIVQRIDATAKPLASLTGKVISGGMVDAYHALVSTGEDAQSFILSSDEYYANHGSTAQGFVTGLYNDLLDRAPDSGGLAFWSDLYQSGTSSRPEIIDAILSSTEAEETKVAGFYQTDLGRTASIATLKTDSGVNFWVQLLNSGASDEFVESFILASPEYLAAHGSSPPTVAAAWYQTVLGRTADSGGLAVWTNLLDGGEPPFSAIEAFDTTLEARETKVARWYQTYLGRTTTLETLKNDSGVTTLATTLPAFVS